MKKAIAKYTVAAFLLFISFSSFSQENSFNETPAVTSNETPAWVSDKGYWVVETNIHQPLQYTVRFYDNQRRMIGTKEITGIKMNINKRKVKMQLKAMLEASWLVWNRENPAADLANKPQ